MFIVYNYLYVMNISCIKVVYVFHWIEIIIISSINGVVGL